MTDLDDLGTTPAPAPSPRPVPTPAPVPVPGRGVPSWFWAVVAACLVGATALLVYSRWPTPTPGPAPAPVTDFDPAFVPVGQTLARRFAADFAASYEDGTKLIASGQPRATAAATASKAFSEARQKSFDEVATPKLEQVVPSSTADDKLTPEDRAKLVRARRGISKGAEGK